ncbi:hypothetical protein ACIQMV_32225 [Streptomyces sp. NPDC091412]|uniref:hypothetical protein n=1 Tax=Streptomyces sp. NPDC091412 TaxID=3366002 RepID=UPI00382A293A
MTALKSAASGEPKRGSSGWSIFSVIARTVSQSLCGMAIRSRNRRTGSSAAMSRTPSAAPLTAISSMISSTMRSQSPWNFATAGTLKCGLNGRRRTACSGGSLTTSCTS